MKRCVLAVGLLLPPLVASADPAPKVAVINLAAVFDGFQMTRDLEQRFEDARRAIGAEAESRRKAIENQLTALEAFDRSSREFAERRAAVQRMQVEYRVWAEVEEQTLKDEHMGWLRSIYDEVHRAVEREAQSRGFDLVLTVRDLSADVPDSMALRQEILLKQVLYFSPRTDLTAPVLTALNQAYAKRGGAASLSAAPPLSARPVDAQ